MADILIKGLALPPKGDTYGLHLSIFPNGEVYVEYDEQPTATAIELPQHGRLIDVDSLIKEFRKWAKASVRRSNTETACLLEELAKLDTIVEASNGSDN